MCYMATISCDTCMSYYFYNTSSAVIGPIQSRVRVPQRARTYKGDVPAVGHSLQSLRVTSNRLVPPEWQRKSIIPLRGGNSPGGVPDMRGSLWERTPTTTNKLTKKEIMY